MQLRIPHTRQAYMVGRYLDLGPSAVLIPEVMEPETVDDAIAYAYYGPIGRRSWGGANRRGLHGSTQGVDRRAYAAWWNDYAILAIQVESVEAVTNIRKLAKPGVSVVTLGPTIFPLAWRITRTIRCVRSMTVCAMSPRNWLVLASVWPWERVLARKNATSIWRWGLRFSRGMRRANFGRSRMLIVHY